MKVVPSILGKSCLDLSLVHKLPKVKSTFEDEDCFNGLGCFKNFICDICIKIFNRKLKIGNRTYKTNIYFLRDQGKAESEPMIELGVLKPISEPTPAVWPLVIVHQKKKLGHVSALLM